MIKIIKDYTPEISKAAYIDGSAAVVGNVILKENSSVWQNAVLRGDFEKIVIGRNSNIQDGVLVHTNHGLPTVIDDNVTIGHGAILHGCNIAEYCMIGMGAILLDGCCINRHTIIAAGALVLEGKQLQERGVYVGIPAKRSRDITDREIQLINERAKEYVELAMLYKEAK